MNYCDTEYCNKCKTTFKLKRITYPSNVDDKRITFITCPYCELFVRFIHLKGDEDIIEMKN